MIIFYSFLAVLFLSYLWMQKKFYLIAWKLGGPIELPFVGNKQLLSRKTVLSFAKEQANKYLSPFTVWIGPLCVVYINDPENIGLVLSSPECSNKSVLYKYITEIIGSGLLSNNNPEWNTHRKFFNPLFKAQNVTQLIPIFNSKVKDVFDDFKKMCQLKSTFDIMKIVKYYTFSVSCETIIDYKGKSKSVEEKKQKIVKAFETLLKTVAITIFNPLYRFDIIAKLIDNKRYKDTQKALQYLTEFVDEAIETNSKLVLSTEMEPLKVTEFNAISHAVKLRKSGLLSTTEIINEINHLILSSYETTSTALLHIFILLAMHPEWQEKLYEEINEMFPDKDVDLTNESIQDTPLTDMVIKESLRLLPVIPIIARRSSADIKLSNGAVVPKGMELALDLYAMHRNPKYWGEDASEFNPYRFLNDEITQRQPNVYLPFSKGVRNCIGWRYANLSIKIFLIKIIQRFRFITSMKLDELEFIFNIAIKLVKRPHFIVEERSS